MSEFASGRHAKAICDICGVRCEYLDLKEIYRAGHPTNVLACTYCWDKDHPQLFLGRKPIRDPQGLRRARPDTGLLDGRSYFDKAKLIEPPVNVTSGVIKATEWYPYQATLQRDALSGPYRSGTGIIISDNTANDLHGYVTRKSVSDGSSVTLVAEVSSYNPAVTDFVLRCQDASGTNVATDVFTLATKSWLGLGFSSGTGSVVSRSIVSLAETWARYTVTFSIAAGPQTLVFFVAPRSGGSASYLGTGITTIGVMADPVIS